MPLGNRLRELTILIVAILPNLLFAQIQLGPTIGVRSLNINDVAVNDLRLFRFINNYRLGEEYGAKLKWKFPDRNSLEYNFLYAKEKFTGSEISGDQLEYIWFNLLSSSALFNYNINQFWGVGIGINHLYFNDENLEFVDFTVTKKQNRHDVGGAISVFFYWNQFEFEISYRYGFTKFYSGGGPSVVDFFDSFQYLQLTTSYLFEIDLGKKADAECPNF